MRKSVVSVIFILMAVLCIGTCANAAQIGDVVGTTLVTDIVASINEYNIASFNIEGYTAVVAEDLRNYGFDVEWVEAERKLYITRNSGVSMAASTYTAPRVSKRDVGKKAHDVLYTDIKAYIDGKLVTSYNIGGQTIIYFNDLAVYGEVVYNDSYRRLDLFVEGMSYKMSYEVVKLVNEQRAIYGLSPLQENYALSDLARLKCSDMAQLGYFDHTSPTYGSPFDMMHQFGFDYQTAGENIAMGQRTPEEVVEGWMNSPGHRANILNAEYTMIGVGYSNYGNIWTQMFMKPW